jgi:exosortase K
MKKIHLKIGVTLGLILILKAIYSSATLSNLQAFIYPMIPVIELCTNLSFEWIPELGYSTDAGIIIEKSCAGGNFFIICFAFLCFRLCEFEGFFKTIIHMSFLGICSYVIMLIANTARIISAIKLSEWEWTHALIDPKTAHLALGSLLYIITLLFIHQFISTKHGISKIS